MGCWDFQCFPAASFSPCCYSGCSQVDPLTELHASLTVKFWLWKSVLSVCVCVCTDLFIMYSTNQQVRHLITAKTQNLNNCASKIHILFKCRKNNILLVLYHKYQSFQSLPDPLLICLIINFWVWLLALFSCWQKVGVFVRQLVPSSARHTPRTLPVNALSPPFFTF